MTHYISLSLHLARQQYCLYHNALSFLRDTNISNQKISYQILIPTLVWLKSSQIYAKVRKFQIWRESPKLRVRLSVVPKVYILQPWLTKIPFTAKSFNKYMSVLVNPIYKQGSFSPNMDTLTPPDLALSEDNILKVSTNGNGVKQPKICVKFQCTFSLTHKVLCSQTFC